jgi:hypothetical protein
MEFLSPNTTSLVRPMDMGIIKNLKTLYRVKLVNYIPDTAEREIMTNQDARNLLLDYDFIS